MAPPGHGPPECAGTVLFGTCGWTTDRTAPWAKGRTSREKLEAYARSFGCVEVDTSTYAIPSMSALQEWLAAALPPGFVFHVKLFGLMAAGRCQWNQLPFAVKALMPTRPGAAPPETVRMEHMPEQAREKCWELFNDLLRALEEKGRLGAVLLQHQNDVAPGPAARARTEAVRRKLLPSAALAVEFRHRDWIATDEALAETTRWLSESCGGAALVCSDDLLHELLWGDRSSRRLAPGEPCVRLPLRMASAGGPGWAFCRIHRRYGGVAERTLPPEVVQDWAALVKRVAGAGALSRGACYVLLGTDCGEAPVKNAAAMSAALAAVEGPGHAYDWAAHCRANPAKASLAALFRSASAAGGGSGGGPEKTAKSPCSASPDAADIPESLATPPPRERDSAASQQPGSRSKTASASAVRGVKRPPPVDSSVLQRLFAAKAKPDAGAQRPRTDEDADLAEAIRRSLAEAEAGVVDLD